MLGHSSVVDLALFGAPPQFSEPLHVGRPNLGSWTDFERRMRQVWDRRWLTNDGPLVREFEQTLQDLLEVKHCIAVCNATIGLEIAARALQLQGEVIVPAFTFVASAHCLRWQGIRPVFCDVDPETHQISLDAAAAAITPRTTGVLAVHLWGNACAVDQLAAFADAHGLKLLFDAAHALGAKSQGRAVGGFGDAEVFSFHATKFVNTFEGGCIATNHDSLAEAMRLMRNFGFAGYDQVVHLGTNGKMSEPAAAMGLTSLESMPEFIQRNQKNDTAYRRAFQGLPGVRLIEPTSGNQSNHQYVVAEVDDQSLGLTRDELLQVLQAENVLARRYFFPGCHRMAPYISEPESSPRPLPVTERLCRSVMQFPTGVAVTEADIEKIGQIVNAAASAPDAVRTRLNQLSDTVSGG